MKGLDFVQALPSLTPLEEALKNGVAFFLRQQSQEGHWWFALEANETIGAGFIQLMHFLSDVDRPTEQGLAKRILSLQKNDGSWPIFYGGPGDLSTTIECYLSLRLTGNSASSEPLERAKKFILSQGGLTKARVFTRIHLALFGLVPWSSSPAMPIWFALLPSWCGISIYEFSSWARASIVPLLLIYDSKPVQTIPFNLNELYSEPEGKRLFHFPRRQGFFSLENLFIQLDRLFKLLEKFPGHPGKKRARENAERWVREHIERTEDIYPAMAYAAIGLKSIGYPTSDPTIQKALNGLKRFQQSYSAAVPRARPNTEEVPFRGGRPNDPASPGIGSSEGDGVPPELLHQQCCISPLWDTPWAGVALIEAGLDRSDPALLKAARYLIQKEIRWFRGDWRFKNPAGPAGGWSFEFQNDYFPDVDDTIQTLFFLKKVGLPTEETSGPITRGLAWILSMQSKNGGWAAFDKDNLSQWVNKIPFADHGACLDPPTPDITGRILELLSQCGYTRENRVIRRAIRFIQERQTAEGPWPGRWGVSYIYGTWAVLQGLSAIGENLRSPPLQKAIAWLKSIQNKDGGWGESCLSDSEGRYVPLGLSVPSQTAWVVMGLISAGERDSLAVRRGVEWLIDHQQEEGGWEEPFHTGTGFPGHFYLNYHGYRHYFPLLALGKYSKNC